MTAAIRSEEKYYEMIMLCQYQEDNDNDNDDVMSIPR